ncbi:RDD family protein [Nereida sp. MMG025]|uniref:RDD family protein n=1 Tax=Nereida sp. MMG025 TaxID=2909981 RepID=UPI001F25129C|nr:RDD family protein [Nereida sp. MMG025]MCF6443568.1 RDD family protein [Nereida sp. MMG025]
MSATATDMHTTLPDPVHQSEFYADTAIKRAIAWLVDLVIITALAVLVSLLTFGIGFFVFFGIMALIGFAYRVVTLANRSATWGMRLASVEFRRADGQRFDLLTAFLHTLAFYLSFSILPLQLVSIVLMLSTQRAQGLTDHVLGTVALNRSAATL